MPFPPRVFYKEYLKQNVLGTIPLLEDGNVRMTESNAISQYLCAKYAPTSLAMDFSEPFYGEYLNWIHHSEATLTFPQTIVLRYTKQEIGRADNAAVDYARWYGARLRMLNSALDDGRTFLVGGRFTIADIAVTYSLYLGTTLEVEGVPLSARYKPQVTKYMLRMLDREGYKNAVAFQTWSEEQFEKLHGNGQDNSKL
eukprot:CAMPEP_0204872172 /NCGR_PEP_ID=MMETSP1348-20121228/37516_1 /ASSEMBLY_ACC=CAM_ASM_000700 /TAXON_ID=215587 /ORGANISM="Aplanochytrium stocchinoi, Strain GSBS06" /LENGTH=197 /DNA_ID=CAMNT_0052026891 /DNA_START=320 /DNA_END=913 /DNA_ORIENTATION=-